MLYFLSDYSMGAHPQVMDALCRTNLMHTPGYGTDDFCQQAKEKIRQACGCPDAEIVFLTGGTQTNQFTIDSLLQPYEGVLCASTGHINCHESGAVEFTGHKVLALPQHDGRISAAELEAYLKDFYNNPDKDHMVFPGMVYISQPTEYGTLYSKAELTGIRRICSMYKMPLFIDGARLSYALASSENDLSLPELASLADAFYIGGTKCGTLFGEALVYTGSYIPSHLTTRIKQHGALLAKGRLLGVQFDALFTDDLYAHIGAHGIAMAERLKKGLTEKGYKLPMPSPTNQLFIILTNRQIAELKDKAAFTFWEPINEDTSLIRLVTSWATTEEEVDQLLNLM